MKKEKEIDKYQTDFVVIDTNVFLIDPNSVLSFQKSTIVVPLIVI